MSRIVYRLGVGTKGGPRSAIWRVWNTGRSGDVYIGARSIAGVLKASLHQSGICQFGFTSPAAAQRGIHQHERLWDRWEPEEFADGFTMPLRLYFPVRSLRDTLPENGTVKKPFIWIQPDPAKGAVAIDFVLATRQPNAGDWPGKAEPGTTLLAHHRLPDDRVLWIVAHARDLERAALDEGEAKAREFLSDVDCAQIGDWSTLRAFYFGRSLANGRFVCEVAGDEVLTRTPGSS